MTYAMSRTTRHVTYSCPIIAYTQQVNLNQYHISEKMSNQ